MRHLVISPHAEANVWIDEDVAACRYDAPLVERRRFTAGDLEIVRARVSVEVAVHVGPRILYGLLGAELRPAAGCETEIEVPHLADATPGEMASRSPYESTEVPPVPRTV